MTGLLATNTAAANCVQFGPADIVLVIVITTAIMLTIALLDMRFK